MKIEYYASLFVKKLQIIREDSAIFLTKQIKLLQEMFDTVIGEE